MTITGAVTYSLLNDSSVEALVGREIHTGVLPPRVKYPAATVSVVDDSPIHANKQDIELRHPMIQVSCFGRTYDDAHDLADAVVAVLQDFQGTLGGDGGVVVDHIYCEQAGQDMPEPQGGRTFHVVTEWEIWYQGS